MNEELRHVDLIRGGTYLANNVQAHERSKILIDYMIHSAFKGITRKASQMLITKDSSPLLPSLTLLAFSVIPKDFLPVLQHQSKDQR